MKKILLLLCLMIQLLAISQTTIIKYTNIDFSENKNDIYKGLVNGDNCRFFELPAYKIAIDSLMSTIRVKNDSIQNYTLNAKKYNLQVTSLQNDKQIAALKIQELQNQQVPWYSNKWIYLAIGIIGGKILLK